TGDYHLPAGIFDPFPVLLDSALAWSGEDALTEVRALQEDVRAFANAPFSARRAITERVSERYQAFTGEAAVRAGGKHYADRLLIHEECQAELTVDLGRAARVMLERSLPPLIRVCSLPTELARENVRAWFRERFGEGRAIAVLEAHRAFDEETA